jgi:hypothetical protein
MEQTLEISKLASGQYFITRETLKLEMQRIYLQLFGFGFWGDDAAAAGLWFGTDD